MKYLQVLALLTALFWTTSDAWAQFGLFGSPGLVKLPRVPSEVSVPSDDAGMPAARFGGTAARRVAGSLSWRPDPAYGDQALPLHVDPSAQTTSAKRPRRRPKEKPAKPKPTIEDAPNVVDEMLGELDGPFPPSREPDLSWEPDTECDPWAGYGDCADDCCDSCLPCFTPKWYVSVSGLTMARGDEPNKVWVTYEWADPANQLMHTGQDLEWRGGGEIRFGRRLCCCGWAIEATYWTLDPFTSMARCTGPGVLATPLDFQDVVWPRPGPGFPISPGDLFNQAKEHRVWRQNEVHNVELSLLRDRVEYLCSGPFDCGWSVGARFFRFEEDLLFGSLHDSGDDFGDDPTLEGYLDDKIINNLVGVQFGCHLDYCVDAWRLYLFPRVGIYNNHIRHRFAAYRGDGRRFAPDPAGYPAYPVNSARDVFSFLTEIDLGLEWQFAAKWSANLGYRATIAAGIGLADDQIPPYVVDTPELADIDYNGYLLLHGGYATLTYRF